MDRQYWIRQPNNPTPIGPIDAKSLRSYVADGVLTPDSEISFDQITWRRASQIRGLFPETDQATTVTATIMPAPTGRTDPERITYDAFISYRHVDPDRKWAKWLHSSLETFRVPRKLVKEQGVPSRIERVFRDEEELPASADLKQEIDTALQESRFLIVVCSPRTPLSLWVNKEVLRFRELGRHDRILALLIEGEPAESFPPVSAGLKTV